MILDKNTIVDYLNSRFEDDIPYNDALAISYSKASDTIIVSHEVCNKSYFLRAEEYKKYLRKVKMEKILK